MFETSKGRYLTRGVDNEIPLALQMFLWERIDALPKEKDYLQVFVLSESATGLQKIVHKQEVPEYRVEYVITQELAPKAVTAKIFVIDDGNHCTMLLAEEY